MRFTGRLAYILILAFLCSIAYAQQPVSDCEQALNQATEEFNAGRFYGVAAMLKSCLDRGFTREQQQRANLLLTQTYLLLDDPIGAETSYLNVLRANPEFEADTARDPVDLVYLSKKFTADPIFSLFGKIGGNVTPVSVIHVINPSGEPNVQNAYSLKIGFQFGGGVDWNITRKLALSAEFNYLFATYKKSQFKFRDVYNSVSEPGRLVSILDAEEFIDKQNWISVPVTIKYSDTKGKIRPYGYVGFAIQWLIADRGQIISLKTDLINGQPTAIPSESPTITLTQYRNALNRSLLLGGGVRYKIGLNYLFADARYGIGLTNVVKPTSTYDSAGPMTEWGHADDYFRIDNFSISVGYVKPLYKPRKLKHARTKSVLKGINKFIK